MHVPFNRPTKLLATFEMRITIITGPFLPTGAGPAGAVEKIWLGLAKVFATKGHQVTVVARQWPGQPSKEVVDGIRFIRLGGFTRTSSIWLDIAKDLLYSVRLLPALPESDVTVINTFWLPVLAVLRKRHLGKSVVNVARFPKGQMGLYRFVDRLSVVSASVAREVIRQAPRIAHLVKIIHNPVDIDCFKVGNPPPPKNNSYQVLYTGRVHPEKGLHLLIKAMAQLIPEFPDLELTVVGPTKVEHGGGGDSYISELTTLSEDLKVTFEEPIGVPASLAARMAKADYYCYPSLADVGESFGVAPLEAMALGYAPILSSLECFSEFAHEGSNCFVFKHRGDDAVAHLTQVLRKAIASPQLTKRMGIRAAQTAQRFSYESIADDYLADWEKL